MNKKKKMDSELAEHSSASVYLIITKKKKNKE